MNILRTLALLLTLFVINGCSTAPVKKAPELLAIAPSPLTQDQWVIDTLKAKGLDEKTVSIFTRYLVRKPAKTKRQKKAELQLAKVIPLNVLGFLYTGDYFQHDSPVAIQKSKKFLKRYAKVLKQAEISYGVSKETITALLWVETQFGKHTGTYQLAQVYLQLLKADHPEQMQNTVRELFVKKADADLTMQQKCVDRSKTKAAWALEQLMAMNEIYKKQGGFIFNVRASFAGAFGIPQFIPLSYNQFAVSHLGHSSAQTHANLYDVRDAIMSVANFLNQKGWRPDVPESQTKALFDYNRSKDYGAVILQIAAKLRTL